jgi:hypothetical protein
MEECLEYLYDLIDICEVQNSLQEAFDLDEAKSEEVMLEFAQQLVERFMP